MFLFSMITLKILLNHRCWQLLSVLKDTQSHTIMIKPLFICEKNNYYDESLELSGSEDMFDYFF